MARTSRPKTLEDVENAVLDLKEVIEEALEGISTARTLPVHKILGELLQEADGMHKRVQRLTKLRNLEGATIIIVDRETKASHTLTPDEVTARVMNYAGHDVLFMLHNFKVENGNWVPLSEQEKNML